MTPPMFDILNLKALGIHVYFATIKDPYCLSGKHLEANAKAIHALRVP